MSDVTVNRAYPFPESFDAPAGHTQIEALANAVDADVAGLPILEAKKSIIATEQSRNSTDWGYLGTNDKVTIDVPANGMIGVLFTAMWKESVQGTAKAAIFLGDTEQLRVYSDSGPPDLQAALLGGTANTYQALTSAPFGLFSINSNLPVASLLSSSTAIAQYAATAQMDIGGTPVSISGVHGGACYVRTGDSGAGSTEVGVKFYRSSGTVTVRDRALFVWTMAFD